MSKKINEYFKKKDIIKDVKVSFPKKLKIGHWNINGLNSQMGKDTFFKYLDNKYDFFLFNETKTDVLKLGKMDKLHEFLIKEKYSIFGNYADKKGYSGVMILTKHPPIREFRNFEAIKDGNIVDLFPSDREGRIITLEYYNFYIVSVYVPNSKRNLSRLDFRTKIWDTRFRKYLNHLKETKEVIVCGDLNVAHKEIDIKHSKYNLKSPGFTIEERNSFDKLLETGFKDTFRELHKDKVKYTWWSYRYNARSRNIGWRLDYFLINNLDIVEESNILDKVMGSDHCPIELIVNFK